MNLKIFLEDRGGSTDGCSDIYKGPFAESEPETRAVAGFLRSNADNILLYISLHAHAQGLYLPWAYTKDNPPEDVDDMVNIKSYSYRFYNFYNQPI